MDHYETIEGLSGRLLERIADQRSALIYAPNTTGKTRLAQHLKEHDPDGVVLYNSYVEDVFTWDNDRVLLKLNHQSELLKIIETQGLDGAIVRNFQHFTNSRIEPTIDIARGEISFGVHEGDGNQSDSVKISRAEESIFVWCVYFSVLSDAIDTLADPPEIRTTSDYDRLTLAVIDDPVSSMDDVRIVSVALELADLIKRASSLNLKFVVTTHHALFFNVLFNYLRRVKKCRAFVLERGSISGWTLRDQPNDSPFSYHLGIVRDLEQAIAENSVQRVHFNQFRALLEKTANFLGYSRGWGDLLTGSDARLLTTILNLYSHDRFAQLDSAEVSEEYKSALKNELETFLKEFRWNAAT